MVAFYHISSLFANIANKPLIQIADHVYQDIDIPSPFPWKYTCYKAVSCYIAF